MRKSANVSAKYKLNFYNIKNFSGYISANNFIHINNFNIFFCINKIYMIVNYHLLIVINESFFLLLIKNIWYIQAESWGAMVDGALDGSAVESLGCQDLQMEYDLPRLVDFSTPQFQFLSQPLAQDQQVYHQYPCYCCARLLQFLPSANRKAIKC